MAQPTHEQLVRRAEELIPALEERAEQAERDRRVPGETIRDLQDAGLFRVLQPARYGGYEMEPQTFFAVQMKLAEGCMSTAWVYGVIAVHNFQLGLFPDRAQQDVWSEDQSTLTASSYAPVGKVLREGDGFRLSGRWAFSSGCLHCDWVLLGSLVQEDDGQGGTYTDYRTFLVPKADFEIVDTWHTLGLRGTGSHDVVVDDAYVPEYRTHRRADGFACTNPGQEVNAGYVFRLPWAQVFACSVAAAAIGAAQKATNLYSAATAKRVTAFQQRASADPNAQEITADAQATVKELRNMVLGNFEEMMAHLREGGEIPIEERVQNRYEYSTIVERCMRVVDQLFTNSGSFAVFDGNEIQRLFRDVHTARAHVANNPLPTARNYGAVHMGAENQDTFV